MTGFWAVVCFALLSEILFFDTFIPNKDFLVDFAELLFNLSVLIGLGVVVERIALVVVLNNFLAEELTFLIFWVWFGFDFFLTFSLHSIRVKIQKTINITKMQYLLGNRIIVDGLPNQRFIDRNVL